MSQAAMLNRGPGSVALPRSRSPIVKANELLFVHFERPDLKRAEQYLRDFGLVVSAQSESDLFMRGTGSQPYIYRASRGPIARLLGIGLSVPAMEDLERLSKAFGRPIETSNAPGGGSVVRLRDPEMKTERTARKTYRTRDQAKADVFDYIECFYNPKRRHSTIGYPSHVEFEMQAGLA